MTQVSRATWASSLTTLINDNTAGEISAADVRSILNDLEDSVEWYDEGAAKAVTQNPQTGTSYTLVLTDADKGVTMSNASANTLTIPTNASVAFPVGTVLSVVQIGAGVTTITGDTGVTVNGVSAGSGDISAQWGGVSLWKTATDTWIASGAHGDFA